MDWKASAKAGSFLVREFTREDERKLRVVFDNPAPGAVEERAYEATIALAASLIWHFAGQNSQLSFVAPGYTGGPDVYRFLTYLALVSPSRGKSALEELPVEFREVIVLRELEGLSYKEIADIAAIPVGTVMSRLARGRDRLQQRLTERLKKDS